MKFRLFQTTLTWLLRTWSSAEPVLDGMAAD
jgi:hypothetical protein